MSRPVLHTDRLELRPMVADHLPWLVDLDGDPEVLRHLLGRARTRREAEAFWGPRCLDTTADAVGLGWWVGWLRDTDAFVGWWDLQPDPPGEPAVLAGEAGWRLARRWWRRGLASEGAAAVLRHGFVAVGLDVVWAETMAVNAGSRGVMARLGMRHVGTEVRSWPEPLPGAELGEVRYEITRSEWLRRAAEDAVG